MIRTLLKQVKEYRAASLLTAPVHRLEVLMEVLIPFVTASIIDKGIQAGDMGQVYFYGVVMLVLAFVSLAAGILAGRFGAKLPRALPATCETPCMKTSRPFQH